jgi:hypothetical protein
MKGEDRLSAELLRLLGESDFIALCENFGGTRLFLPKGDGRGALKAVVSDDSFAKLNDYFAGSYIRVPLARALRARHYRAAGLSNAQIAVKLGVTETAIDKQFTRMVDKPVKGSANPHQIDLFISQS